VSGPAPVPLGRRERRRRRRRAGRAARRRGLVALLPQLLTTGNLAAGFYSVTLSAEGAFSRAALAILLAGVFDVLDGRVARLARATSRFGAEYDSIADTVSFGVAPAMLAYGAGSLHALGWTGWVLAFLYAACAALRLARFNVSPGRYRGRFEGLPSPAAAGMVLSSVWFGGLLRAGGAPLAMPPAVAGIGVAVVGVLMVSPIPYRSFKEIHLRGSYRAVVLMVIAFAVILSKPSLTFFPVVLAYVLSGPIEAGWRWRTGRTLEEVEPAGEGKPGAGIGGGPEDDRENRGNP
jgi:CDP-diacylglycerol--serine O-phosphatidyltransferase